MDDLIAFCNDSGSTMKETLELNEDELQVCLEMMNYKNLRKAKIINQWRKEKKEFEKKSAAKRWLVNKREKEERQQTVGNAITLQLDPAKLSQQISLAVSGSSVHSRKTKCNPGALVLSKSSHHARKSRSNTSGFGLSHSTHSAILTPSRNNTLTLHSNHETKRRQSAGVVEVTTTEKRLTKYNSFDQVMDKHQNIAADYRKKYGKEVEVTTIYRPGLPSVTVMETSEHRRTTPGLRRVSTAPSTLDKLKPARRAPTSSQLSALGLQKLGSSPGLANQNITPRGRTRQRTSSVGPIIKGRTKKRVHSTNSLQSVCSQPSISTAMQNSKWWDLSDKSVTAPTIKKGRMKKRISSTTSVQSTSSQASGTMQNAKWELSQKRSLPESSKLARLLKTMDLESTAANTSKKAAKATKKKTNDYDVDLKQDSDTKKKKKKKKLSQSLTDTEDAAALGDDKSVSSVSSKSSIKSGSSVSAKSSVKSSTKKKKKKKSASSSLNGTEYDNMVAEYEDLLEDFEVKLKEQTKKTKTTKKLRAKSLHGAGDGISILKEPKPLTNEKRSKSWNDIEDEVEKELLERKKQLKSLKPPPSELMSMFPKMSLWKNPMEQTSTASKTPSKR